MKKIILALVLGGMVFSAAYAAAASLGLTTDDLGAGDEQVFACDTSSNVTYTTALIGTQYNLFQVVINGLDARCDGQSYKISVLVASGGLSSPDEISGTITTPEFAGNNLTVDFTGSLIRAEDINHIAVVITGAP